MKNWLDKYKDEIPSAQNGKTITPTRQDSLDVYNNSKKVEKYYKNTRGYSQSSSSTNMEYDIAGNNLHNANKIASNNYKGKVTIIDSEGIIQRFKGIRKEDYRKDLNKNKYLQRENADKVLNGEAPMQLFDKRINPKGALSYRSPNTDDYVEMATYNNIANKPFDLLTAKEKEQRVKQYGREGVPNSYGNKADSKQSSNFAPTQKANLSVSKTNIPKYTNVPNKKTIQVDSKNDPRYRAYQDSLTLYNYGQNLKKILNTSDTPGEFKESMEKIGTKDIYSSTKYTGKQDIVKKSINDLEKLNNKKVQIISEASKDFKLLGITTATGHTPIYKKPTQPVEVKKQTNPNPVSSIPKKSQPTQLQLRKQEIFHNYISPLTPQGIQQQDFNLETDLPNIRPQFNAPSYYDVEDIVNNGKSQTNYQWYPENGESLRQLSEQSGDKRKMVPHYQDGGDIPKEQVDMEAVMASVNASLPPSGFDQEHNNKVHEYSKQYINSPKTKERTFNMWAESSDKLEGNPEERYSKMTNVFNTRIDNINSRMSNNSKYAESRYDVLSNSMLTNPNEYMYPGSTNKGTTPHEYAHVTQYNEGNKYEDFIDEKTGEVNYAPVMSTEHKNLIKNSLKPGVIIDEHDADPFETRADIHGARYLLYDKKIYDAKKEDFNKQHLDKLNNNEDLQKEGVIQRLKGMYSDDSIIQLMNKITYNNTNTRSNKSYAKNGVIIKDDNGYWNPNNWGKDVEIASGDITMDGVYEPLIGISKQTGEQKLMIPGNNYKFANTENVIEKPIKNWLNEYK